jgi:hypothetical protein
MTPTQLNKAIRAGEMFYLPDPAQKFKVAIILKAKSLHGKVYVQVEKGKWQEAEYYRRPGSFELFPLTAEGERTWYKNA